MADVPKLMENFSWKVQKRTFKELITAGYLLNCFIYTSVDQNV